MFLNEEVRTLGTGSIMNNMLQREMLEKFNCEKCRFSTKDPNKYRNHVSLHNDIKYACSHCDFVSYTKTEFQRHLVTHTGKFPYTCGYCGYGAIRNDYIVKHIRRIHGDGKIQCSVSTVENESKKASINIMQTHMMMPNVQNISQDSPSPLPPDVIDLTEMDSLGSCGSVYFPNGENIGSNFEVEVISPVDQPLYPWMPLTVVAPASLKLPPNCIAQVLEVKPVNSACHLILKCLSLVESNVPVLPVTREDTDEKKPSQPDILCKNKIGTPGGPLLPECAVLQDNCQENILYPSNTVYGTEENLQANLTFPSDNANEIINTINDDTMDIFDDLEEFTEGPIISSVFSLSSDPQNTIEGIQWECPFGDPSSSNDINALQPSLNLPTSEEAPMVCDSEINLGVDIERSQDILQNTVSECDKESEIQMENVTQSADPEIQLPIITPGATDVKKPESQPCVLRKRRKGGRISERLRKMETNHFSKPQTLFLSCDKRIVMQPLSCTMQSNYKTSTQVGNITDPMRVPLKMRKESAKGKVKRLLVPTVKSRSQPYLRTLSLHPFKMDQVAHMPSYNQPVVVLNHPDIESMETSHIMKAIRVFRGKIKKITLSKKMCKKFV